MEKSPPSKRSWATVKLRLYVWSRSKSCCALANVTPGRGQLMLLNYYSVKLTMSVSALNFSP
jgi:hypothetical protein